MYQWLLMRILLYGIICNFGKLIMKVKAGRWIGMGNGCYLHLQMMMKMKKKMIMMVEVTVLKKDIKMCIRDRNNTNYTLKINEYHQLICLYDWY